MSEATQNSTQSVLKNKTWIWLAAAFALLVAIGVLTS